MPSVIDQGSVRLVALRFAHLRPCREGASKGSVQTEKGDASWYSSREQGALGSKRELRKLSAFVLRHEGTTTKAREQTLGQLCLRVNSQSSAYGVTR